MKEKYYPSLYNFGARLLGLTRIYTKAVSLIEPGGGDSVLDVACGTGKLLRQLQQKFAGSISVKFFGIDIDPSMIDKAQHDAGDESQIKFKIASATDLPFLDGTMDWVISTLAVHHMTDLEKQLFVKEAFRVLKPGGRLLVSDLGRPRGGWGRFLAFLSSCHTDSLKNMEIFEAEVNRAGLKIKEIYPQFGYVEHLLAVKP